MKKTLIFALCVISLLFTLVIFGASADEATPVSNAADFEAMVTGGNYYLTNDIDLGGKEYSRYIFSEFHGTIDGKGYTVKNFSIKGTADGYNAMIAKADGILHVKDLNIGTEASPISVTGEQKVSHGTAVLLGAGNSDYTCIIDDVDIYANIVVNNKVKAKFAGFVAQGYNITVVDSTFNGSIEVGTADSKLNFASGETDTYLNVAGFIGGVSSSTLIMKNCVNNANIVVGPSVLAARGAGFVAYTDKVSNLIDCVNNGNITCLDPTDGSGSDSFAAGMIVHTNHYAAMLHNCKNNGTLTAAKKGNMVARSSGGAYLLDGTPSENAVAVVENNSFVYVEGDYTGYIDVATAEQFLAMTSGNKYRLTADIDLGGVTFEDSIFKGDFSGVIDGMGHKVYNFNLKHVSGDTAIFTRTVERVPFVLTNIQFGTADNLIKVDSNPASGKSQAVVLSGTHSNGTAWFNNMDVYADFTTVGLGQKYCAGGIIAYARHITLEDCDYYGKMTVGDFTNNKDNTVWRNSGAITGAAQGIIYLFGCDNYAELKLSNGSGEVRLAPLCGYVAYASVFANCNNYGNVSIVTNVVGLSKSQAHIAGLVAESNNAGTLMYNCENFGDVTSDDGVVAPFVAGIIARVRNVCVTIIDCENNNTVTGAKAKELVGDTSTAGFTHVINFVDMAGQTPVTPEEPDVTTSGDVTTTTPTDDVTTTTPSGDTTTTVPTGDDTTTVPADNDTTTVPADNDTTTAEPIDNTTAKPEDDPTEKPDNTTTKPDEPGKKSCGGFAVALQLIAILGAAVTVVSVKKK